MKWLFPALCVLVLTSMVFSRQISVVFDFNQLYSTFLFLISFDVTSQNRYVVLSTVLDKPQVHRFDVVFFCCFFFSFVDNYISIFLPGALFNYACFDHPLSCLQFSLIKDYLSRSCISCFLELQYLHKPLNFKAYPNTSSLNLSSTNSLSILL